MKLFTNKKLNTFTYLEHGQGHPLVLLHGLMGGLSNFQKMADFFSSRGYRVLIPQLPIHDLPVLSTNLSSLAKYIVRFLNEVVGEPVTIVGNSMGGHIGLIMATDYREWVHSLVLTGSSGLYERSFGDSFPRKGDREYIKRKTQEVFYDPQVATEELVDEVFAVVNDRMKGIKTVLLAKSAIKHNMAEEMKKISCPVCIIWGENDNVTPPEVATEMNRIIPDSELFWIPKCGHAAMMERPEEFNLLLHSWLLKKNIV